MVAPEDLKQYEFFKGMNMEMVQSLLNRAKEHEKNGVIFNEGDKGTSLLIVVEGVVEVLTKKRKEGEHNVVATLNPGDIIGELALVGDNVRSAQCRTGGGKPAKVLELDEADFAALKKESPQVCILIYEKILKIMSNRFKRVAEKQDRWSFWL